ncbi:hypothetical protein [Haloferax sp. DFSO60]|uniref:hypothetical protein n=1 Tax=Haloferax sp. DFSO60 TaxID=3388652 RepID=UPI00397CE11F
MCALTSHPKRDLVTTAMLALGAPFLHTPRPEIVLIGVLFVAAGVYGTVDSIAELVTKYVRL